MQNLSDALARLGANQLAELLGFGTISILETMDGKQVAPHKLADLVIRQFGSDGLLLDRPNRTTLIESLSDEDAHKLCRHLDLVAKENPWAAICRCRFDAGSDRTGILYKFFGCEVPVVDDTDVRDSVIEIDPNYQLFEHQISACRKAARILEGTVPRVLLHMPTGAGKTRTAMNLIAHFARHRLDIGDVVIWLAHSEELCEQAAEEFEKAWTALGIRKLTLHRCFGEHCTVLSSIDAGVVVGGLQMMFSRSQSDQSEFLRIARRAKLVVMDEAHQAIAPTYKHILDFLTMDPSTGVLGLSATPGRSTIDAWEDLKLVDFFNKQKVTLEVDGYDSPVEYLQAEGYLAQVNYERLKYSPSDDFQLTASETLSLQQGLDVPTSLLEKLGADEKRNLLILSRILEVAEDKSRKVIVFACSVDHAHLIANILTVKGVSAAAITSRTKASSRRELIRNFRDTDTIQVLTNYGVLTTGFDAPRTNTAVIARPTDSVVLFSQMVGRAARGVRAGGNRECNVITIVDELPGFRSIAEAFEYWNDIWE